ncbi:hypothetical protein PAXINDRAFT_93962 [Paxillus involutus ATCC 200175]|uniref:Integrase catalytic domain-containing protein n=1 Tax=Paxillus involutus ATCC 200175 TaxID=664439 RepID=A0A0C9TA15_PAXIN|nr:hypothetical protein PAXINDRAFT_93962 [Paxillus involutus ATCC 200175]
MNGPEFKGVFAQLLARHDIPQITISPYNSQANGVVERGHFTLREALVKSCEGKIHLWPSKFRQALFTDNVTTSKVTGFSAFYLLHGVHLVLPFDLTDATFLLGGYRKGLTTAELLALRIQDLEWQSEDIEQAAESLRKSRSQKSSLSSGSNIVLLVFSTNQET